MGSLIDHVYWLVTLLMDLAESCRNLTQNRKRFGMTVPKFSCYAKPIQQGRVPPFYTLPELQTMEQLQARGGFSETDPRRTRISLA